MPYTYKIELNTKKDAWNWWQACNRIGHGVDWKKKTDPEIVKHLYQKSQKQADLFLIPFLEKKYLADKNELIKARLLIENEFKNKFEAGCEKIVQIMGKPLYRNDFHFCLTTFGRAPYNEKKGEIWLPIHWTDPMGVFLHELCHFQFIHYWRQDQKSSVSKLSDDQFEFLKESLTIILDNDFLPIIQKPDEGYKLHQELREELKSFWQGNKDFEVLVKFGVQKVSKYI